MFQTVHSKPGARPTVASARRTRSRTPSQPRTGSHRLQPTHGPLLPQWTREAESIHALETHNPTAQQPLSPSAQWKPRTEGYPSARRPDPAPPAPSAPETEAPEGGPVRGEFSNLVFVLCEAFGCPCLPHAHHLLLFVDLFEVFFMFPFTVRTILQESQNSHLIESESPLLTRA